MPEDAPAPTPPPAPATPEAAPDREAPPAGPAVAERPKTSPPKVEHLPPFKVLLHNDDHNDMLWVVTTIVELTPHPKTRAVELMLEAHDSGVALLLVTHQERAELYQEQFKSKGLTVTIEPAE